MSDRSEKLRAARRRRMLDELRGRPRGLVPRTTVTERIDALVAVGFSQGAIASAVLPKSRSTAYTRGRDRASTYMAHGRTYVGLTAQEVFERAAPECMVPSFAALRRYQALQWLGWPQAEIESAAVLLGGSHAWCNMLVPGERISARRHRAMRAAYDELSNRPGPSARTAALAKSKGFQPPLAWDDIDDPNEDPTATTTDKDLIDRIAIERVLAGDFAQLTSAEVTEAIRVGAARGLDCRQMAELLHMKANTLSRRAARAGIHTKASRISDEPIRRTTPRKAA